MNDNGNIPGEGSSQYPTEPAQQPYYQQPTQPQPTYQTYQQPTQPQHTSGQVVREKQSSGLRTFLLAFAGAAVACIIGLGGFTIWQSVNGSGGGTAAQLGSTTSTDIVTADEDDTLAETVASKALPSVAAIDVYTTASTSMYGYGYSNSSSGALTQSSLGSGVVLTEDGYIITNYHVIEGADALKVTVEGEEYDAEVIGSDSSSDIAVIKANATGFTPIELGDSDNLTIGEWVMTIGSPYGLEQSVATGIVSATSRSQILNSSTDAYGNSTGEYTIYANMIQTDAAINPGNSGGALVDEDGKLIGINTLVTSYTGTYSGVGFAIPMNYAVNLADQIIAGKTPTHAQLGVTLSTVNSTNAQRYGLPVSSGAYIASVTSGSGAANAGIQEGDIVTKFDGQDVSSASDLMLDVRAKNPGDVVSVEYNRNGETKTVDVTLGSDEASSSTSTQQNSSSSMLQQLLGGGSSSNNNGAPVS